jgi:hypothetical protein
MRKRLINVLSRMTVRDFESMTEFEKAHALLQMLETSAKPKAKRVKKEEEEVVEVDA